MNEQIESDCSCQNCPESGCACGCQSTAASNGCACGTQCNCGTACACATPRGA